ncbi:MAG: Mur ligase family protein [Myxococcota bacterium]|jgi:UDP-N-acetylmuramyl tripeptide synthase|nr:Mur ligase family protein [Myxococcota bacterium]
MLVTDTRRLTGPNLQTRLAAATAQVQFENGESPEEVVDIWQQELKKVCAHLPFDANQTTQRVFKDGAALTMEAPIDVLYAAVAAMEKSLQRTQAALKEQEPENIDTITAELEKALEEEQNPALLALQEEAQKRNVPFLWDDDFVSLGYGRYSQTWPARECPSPADLSWEKFKSIPIAIITGTNGKTTSARLLARMVRESGLTIGNSSTDGIHINGQSVEEGDWTGPGAARMILRHREVECAILETARGGILRRGLGVDLCDASLVTNVDNDHLGDYGINSIQDMAKVKGVVYSVVKEHGQRVYNVDDPYVQNLAEKATGPGTLTSVNGQSPQLKTHLENGGAIAYLENGELIYQNNAQRTVLTHVKQMPLAQNGTALYNISNALGCTALAVALGIDMDAIKRALKSFGAQASDNPGRGNMLNVNKIRVLLDFGHNPHGVRAVMNMGNAALKSKERMSVCIGQAGDRSNEDIQELAGVIAQAKPAHIFLREMPEQYLRGRKKGEVIEVFRACFIEQGLSPEQITAASSELEALKLGLAWAEPGDFVIHLVHMERQAIQDYLGTLNIEY